MTTTISLNVINPDTTKMRAVNDEIRDDSVAALVAMAKAVKAEEGGRLRIVLVIPRPGNEPHNIGGWVTRQGLNALEEMIAKSAAQVR